MEIDQRLAVKLFLLSFQYMTKVDCCCSIAIYEALQWWMMLPYRIPLECRCKNFYLLSSQSFSLHLTYMLKYRQHSLWVALIGHSSLNVMIHRMNHFLDIWTIFHILWCLFRVMILPLLCVRHLYILRLNQSGLHVENCQCRYILQGSEPLEMCLHVSIV